MAQSSNPFWDYSLAVYGRAGVAEACLGLQDRHGLNVNLLLFACWAGSRSHGLTPDELGVLTAAAADWHAQVVVPLRGLRRWLKGRAGQAGSPVDKTAAAKLRDRIKAQELEAERIEQDLLHETLPLAAGASDPAAAAGNLLAFCQAAGIRLDQSDSGDLATLLARAFPDLPPAEAQRLLS